MKSLIISCETNKPEIECLLKRNGISYPAVYLDAKLHDRPDRLRMELQKEVDKAADTELILLAMGYCGQALIGLKAGRNRLVIPKVDDCLSMFLGSMKEKTAVGKTGAVYYLTKGWLDSERSIRKQYEALIRRFGKEKTEVVFEAMFGNYKKLALIDTALFPIEPQIKEMEKISELLDISGEVIPGTTVLFEKLLVGPYDEDFIVISQHEEISRKHFAFLY